MSPDLQRRKTFELFGHWTLALSEAQALVVLVEDLHWCDASSLELLGRLVVQSATARTLFIATARPEFAPPWRAHENVTTLPLPRLTAHQARDMFAALGGTELPTSTLDALIARADGVPLYVEELTKSVMEPGAARDADAIPATLADSLMARLDRLSTAKEVAQRAAVLGREFSYPLLAAVAGMEEAALRHGLARLVEAEIVFARGEPPAASYTFKHALVQEAAYESLLKRTRQQLHSRVVDVLLEHFRERVESAPEIVARHAESAGRAEDAIAYYTRAGEQAQSRSAHGEALVHFRNAIALLAGRRANRERDTHEIALQLALAVSLIAARGYAHAETEAAYARAHVLAETTGAVARLGMIRLGLAMVHFNRGDIERGRTLAADVLAAAEARGDDQLTMDGHAHVAIPEHYQGRFVSSLQHCEAVLALYDPERHHRTFVVGADQRVAALAFAAWNHWQLGYPVRALAGAREAVILATRLAHPFSLALAFFFEATVHWLRHDAALQRERAGDVLALAEAQGFPLWLGAGRMLHGAACVAEGDLDALPRILEGIALAAETGNHSAAPAYFALLGATYLAAGQVAEARSVVETGLAVATETKQAFFDADLYRLQGELALASDGVPMDSEVLFQRALATARTQEGKSFELRAATSLARLWRDRGKPSEARLLLAPLYGWFTEGFDTRDLRDAKALLDELA